MNPRTEPIRAIAQPDNSPEGRAAHPEIGGLGMLLSAGFIVAAFAAAAVVLALVGSPSIAVGMIVMAGVLLIVNPVLWAGVQRAKERPDATL